MYPEPDEMGDEIGAMLRRCLPMDGDLPKPLPAGDGDSEAVQDFLRDCKALGLPADAEATPEITAAHLIKRYLEKIAEIARRDEMRGIDLDAYNFADEENEVIADSERRIRSISAAMRVHGFKDPTRHAYTRAFLKRLREKGPRGPREHKGTNTTGGQQWHVK
jgi:hypothetical protein